MVLGFVCPKKTGCSDMKGGAGVCYGLNYRDISLFKDDWSISCKRWCLGLLWPELQG